MKEIHVGWSLGGAYSFLNMLAVGWGCGAVEVVVPCRSCRVGEREVRVRVSSRRECPASERARWRGSWYVPRRRQPRRRLTGRLHLASPGTCKAYVTAASSLLNLHSTSCEFQVRASSPNPSPSPGSLPSRRTRSTHPGPQPSQRSPHFGSSFRFIPCSAPVSPGSGPMVLTCRGSSSLPAIEPGSATSVSSGPISAPYCWVC